MKIIFFLCFSIISFAQSYDIQDIFTSSDFNYNSLSQVNWKNSDQFSFVSQGNINLYDISRDSVYTVLESDIYSKLLKGKKYLFSSSGNEILIADYNHPRYSQYGGNIYLYNLLERNSRKILNKEQEIWMPEFLDDSTLIFTTNGNLALYNIPLEEVKLITTDATKENYYGIFDWTYREELDCVNGKVVSPNKEFVAFWNFDISGMNKYLMPTWEGKYNEIDTIDYTKPGDVISKVKILIYSFKEKTIKQINFKEKDHVYFPRMSFAGTDSLLFIQVLNREQNHSYFYLVNINNMQKLLIFEETSGGWIDALDNYFFSGDSLLIYKSEQSGYSHIHSINLKNNLNSQITDGMFEVSAIESIDETKEVIYFSSNERSILQSDLYSINFNGSNKSLITDNYSFNQISITDSPKYFICNNSTYTALLNTDIYNISGRRVKRFYEGKNNEFEKHNFSPPEFFTIETTDNFKIDAALLKPVNFDENKAYPLVIYMYGGPGSKIVLDKFNRLNLLWNNYLTNNGYAVMWLDNTGTSGRGTTYKHIVYKNLGDWETKDLGYSIDYLKSKKIINISKIGIWGWSYGGYVSSLALGKLPDIIDAAVSVAPVTDWNFYDNIYTERFMGLPSENVNGYKYSSVIEYVKDIKGKLFLVHGTNDDNVHIQNSFELVNELIKYNIDFDLMIYPGRNHSISDNKARIHLFSKIFNFFESNLKK